MTRAPDSQPFPVDAFCLHCGLVQDGMLYAPRYGRGRSSEQVVVVHCEGCAGASRHIGSVGLYVTDRLSVISGRGGGA